MVLGYLFYKVNYAVFYLFDFKEKADIGIF